jgi:predicted DNA-binding transcriptional regulator YafY
MKGTLARLILEQHWPGARPQPDGSVEVDTPADHADALLRSFLPWAPDLVVLDPPESVKDWAALKLEMRQRHGALPEADQA